MKKFIENKGYDLEKLKEYNENYKKISEDLEKISKNFNWLDIADSIEISCILSHTNLRELQEIFDSGLVNDGINSYGLFVMTCTEKYKKSRFCSLYEFISNELDNCIEEFIKNYYTIEER